MFEDIKAPTDWEAKSKDLQKDLIKGYDLVKEASDKIKELENENHIMDRKYNNVYQDVRRLAGIISKEIKKDRLDEILKEQAEIEKILEDANILDD